MRVALVHSAYSSRQPSGENAVVEAEATALQGSGYEVGVVASRTDDLEGQLTYPIRSALRVATGRGHSPMDRLRQLAPDIVHVHNLFPNFGRRWVREVPVPVVHTLHNFRPFCANAMLLRDGRVCTLCPDGAPGSALRHGCYRGSRVATAPLALANRHGAARDPLLARADAVVVLSPRQRAMLEDAGVDPLRIVDGANFLPSPLHHHGAEAPDAPSGWLFVGRLSEEKGIARLLHHWPPGESLTIVGDGPQRQEIQRLADAVGARLLGQVDRHLVLELMAQAWGVVFPSLWVENAPLTYIEAISRGVPVVAFEPTTVAELLRRDGTGAVATWDDAQLRTTLDRVRAERRAMGKRGEAAYQARYTEAAFIARTTALYERLVAGTPDPRW